jgi:hypothetical protein
MNRLFNYFFLLLFLIPLGAPAQGPTEEYKQSEIIEQDFDREKWSRITKEVQYDLDKLEEKKNPLEDIDTAPEETSPPPPSFDFGDWSVPAKIILILFFVALIAIIIIQVMKNKNQKIDKKDVQTDDEIIEQIEDNIEASDIESFLDKAIREGNYSLAIRLHYLNILKSLSMRGFIKWKKNKTNRAYLYELKEKQLKNDFQNLTNIFDRIWYGNVILQKEEFESLAPVFEIFSDKIKNGVE